MSKLSNTRSRINTSESHHQDNTKNEFQYYIRILNEHGIKDAEKQIKDMFFVNYIIGNFDRHLNNFGIIRNVNTLKWEKIAPIYDCGESMCCDKNFLPEINLNITQVNFFLTQIYQLKN